MCGISGFNWKDESKVRAMVDRLAHRGPDADGIFVDDNISLGHNRLSIIDLSESANQPMHDTTGELTIVFNGEIYNFRELKEELEGEYEFKTKSDTEVILAGYKKWGKGVVNKLNGMFAFAMWDGRSKELFCARDHAGIKPFYYFWDGRCFIFASEIKAILEHSVPRALNKDAFNHYLRVLYVPEPMTMIQNIYKLPPRGILTLAGGNLEVEQYDIQDRSLEPSSYDDAKSQLRQRTIESVTRQLVADVPVGVYLSGGIDSSTVLFSAARSVKRIKTFSVGFDLEAGEESEKFNADFELAQKTADFFGSDHHPFTISVFDVCHSLERAVAQCDDPVSNPTSVAMLLLAQRAKREVSVVLNGSGGDELFGGYKRYQLALAAYYYAQLPAILRTLGSMHPRIAKLEHNSVTDLFARFLFIKDDVLSRVVADSVFAFDVESKKYFASRYLSTHSGDLVECLMRADQESWLPDFFFMLSDKMSMGSALEERMPLTDRELVAFSRNVPRRYKVDLFGTKKILKDAFRNDLPAFLFSQPKRGWFSPGAKWLRNLEFAAFAREILSPQYYSGTRDIINWPEVERMLERHIDKEEYNLTVLWALLTFQIWARAYKIEV